MTSSSKATAPDIGEYQSQLWRAADTLRGNIDAAEYKHVVLPLIFLKYISDAFEELHEELKSQTGDGVDPEEPDYYKAKNVFWVPREARWSTIQAQARQETNGATIDQAMTAIERDNQALRGVLPKDYGRDGLDKQRLGEVIDLVSNIKVGGANAQATDALGRVVVDIFAEAGLRKPDISVLSDEFLDEVKGMTRQNLAVDLLQKLIRGEISTRRRQNMVQARSFAGMLEETIRRYENRAIEAAQVIEELVELAREIREATARGEELGLTEEELAFYDALETNDSAVKILGNDTLRAIAQELVETIRNNITVDWTLRESVRANMRIKVRQVLNKHGYPPDKQPKAIQTVIQQAELLSEEWVPA